MSTPNRSGDWLKQAESDLMAREEAILWPKEPEWTRDDLIASLRRSLADWVDEAWLFGSYAAGTADDGSDVDLILVRPTTLRFTERFRDFMDLWKLYTDIDLVIYTPGEWRKMLAEQGPFITLVSRNWVRVI